MDYKTLEKMVIENLNIEIVFINIQSKIVKITLLLIYLN